MNFMEAMSLARQGKRVQREDDVKSGWSVSCPTPNDEWTYFDLYCRRLDKTERFTPNCGDIFASDWRVVEEEK